MLSQQDDSFKHISPVSATLIVAGLHTAVNTALSGGELRWSFFGSAVKTIKVD